MNATASNHDYPEDYEGTPPTLLKIDRRVFSEAAASPETTAASREEAAAGAIWSGGGREAAEAMIVEFCAGRDVVPRPMADAELVPYDLWTNAAHVVMLSRQRIVTREQAARLLDALEEIERRHAAGDFRLDPNLEDVHMNIERAVGTIVGDELAGRMHTGRSRNDQSATDVRLWLRDRMLEAEAEVHVLVHTLLNRAEQWAEMPMPGYTHQQPAMVSSLGLWAAAHAQALVRDVRRLRQAYRLIDYCPLGSAAGFGTSWPLDRDFVSNLLSFKDLQEVALDCVTNRWEAEASAVQALAIVMVHLSTVAQDIIVMTSPPHRFLKLPERYTTGSSIMPQKRNPDFAEVIRARAAHVQGHLMALLSQAKGMISGYNRDTQWSKYAMMDAVDESRNAAAVLSAVVEAMEPDAPAMAAACRQGFLNAVEVSDFLCREHGIDFRRAYKVIGAAVKECLERGELTREAVENQLKSAGVDASIEDEQWDALNDPQALLQARRTAGSPSPYRLSVSVRNLNYRLLEARRKHARRLAKLSRSLQTIQRLRSELTNASAEASVGSASRS